ncbi:uncharacterized protein LOC130441462 [Diorhabda sublineata]|uniref:uncharacterized protein LOC130441462 n=1 Tax=Diorhabda sublineata TaxID=1163346 RepID=UPI0024E0C8FE|nr:uncharacterized protein LOC130441462 [Diorhabda sublineata]
MFSNFTNVFFFLGIAIIAGGAEYKITDQVYFDINIENEYLGRIILGLFGEVAPKTCKNFKEIVQHGINGKSYIGTRFHTAISRVMIQGGDIINDDGSGSISIYGDYFEDENFTIKHESAGLLAMANEGPNTNGCQFLITTMACPWLDGKNVIFGKVLKGAAVVHTIEHLKTDINEKILKHVFISNSGVIETEPFYEESKNYELTFWSWIKAGWLPLGFSFATLAFFQFIMAQLDKYEITKS